MPSKDGLSSSPTTYDGWGDDGLYSNPFDEAPHKPFTSALDASSRRTVIRRRGSDGALSAKSMAETSKRPVHTVHSRSRTVDDSPEGVHPLRRSSSAKSWRSDMGNTRPRLSRMVSSTRRSASHSPDEADLSDHLESQGRERTVLIHEVDHHDSLAGVALKYGIAIADLRRANQLWASDSIHLRKHLYIPVDKARHARLTLTNELSESRSTTSQFSDTASAPPDTAPATYSVHRVPATTLSYFPPSSSNPSLSALPSSGAQSQIRTAPSSPASLADLLSPDYFASPHAASPARTHSASSNLRVGALSSLFSVLPITATTRHELMSRLSVESTSSSTTGSEDQEHEMSTVPTTPRARTKLTSPIPFVNPSKRSPNSKHSSPPLLLSRTPSFGQGKGKGRTMDVVEHIALGSSPIRTMQMQPAPTMQLPEQIVRSTSKTGSDRDSSEPTRPRSRSRQGVR